MAINISQLKIELATDPKTLGYYSMSDKVAANKLNEIGASSETIDRDWIDSERVMRNVDKVEYFALTQQERDMFHMLMVHERLRIDNAKIRGLMTKPWASQVGTITKDAMVALRIKSATRAEILFGVNKKVQMIQVHKARRLP